ncbi:hypothetical protein POTOM_034237 [Populus tomentosa]|uniref:Retroviral polymerase SH3-like domain-containing protein n=1 Tax=Populus tomentosa TaxID=118781 RepID=A0A8X8CP55_POPTO|nr:hypothetical protein POTOM_034237 [Populus tomentosa]
MRLHSGLPQTFWADAVHTAVYLINRGPSVPLEFRLPEEVWRGKEVQLSHLKVFGCVSYVHIDSDARNKLEAKSKKCFFIGYGDEEFGFRFWDDQNRKIIRSRNVIFNEKVIYKDRSSEETEMADSDTSPQRSEFIRLEGLPDVTKPNNNQESLQEDSSTSVPTTTQEDVEPIEPAVRRSSRTIKPPQRFTLLLNYILLTDGGEPLTYEESLQDGNSSNLEITKSTRDAKNLGLFPIEALSESILHDDIHCSDIKCFPGVGPFLPKLRMMIVYNCKRLKSLSNEMRKLTSLQELTICSCIALESFPNGDLPPNLISLETWDCENLDGHLSKWNLQSLAFLRDFSIAGGC